VHGKRNECKRGGEKEQTDASVKRSEERGVTSKSRADYSVGIKGKRNSCKVRINASMPAEFKTFPIIS
jgi:hypothetical protein